MSLAYDHFLLDAICKKLQAQQNSADFFAAVEVHGGEIQRLRNDGSPDVSGGGTQQPVDSAVITVLESDAETQRQIMEDHLLALNAQARLNLGEEVFEDSEVARDEQRRLDELAILTEFDRRYAATLAERPGRTRPQAPQQSNEVRSLFALAIDACSASRINVADAIPRAQVRIFGHEQDAETIVQNAVVSDVESDVDDGIVFDRATYGTPMNRIVRIQDLPDLKQCNVCYEENVKGVEFACDHPCCVACLRSLFQTVLRDSSLMPIRCCDVPIDTTLAAVVLRRTEFKALSRRITEFEAKRKMFCPSCNEFINLDFFDPDIDDFPCDCGAHLCAICSTEAHPHVTCRDNQIRKDGNNATVLELAESMGWKQCPECHVLIEFTSGCNHMACRCGHDFCYICLSPWSAGTGRCSTNRCAFWDENRLLQAAENRVQQNIGNRVIAQPERARLIQREINALENHEECRHVWTRQNFHGECERCSFTLWVYGMRCQGGCRSMVCYTCAHHRIPPRGWR